MYEPLSLLIQQISPQFETAWKALDPLLMSKRVSKGEFLFQEEDVCEFVGLTLKGCLRTLFLKDGKELTLFFHPENHVLGDYQNFRLQRPACFSCQAIKDSEILIVNQQVFQALETAPDGQRLLRLIVEHLGFRLRDRLMSLYRDTPEQRYLHLLKTEPDLLERIPQRYLASYLGIEPESLSRLKRRIYQQSIS